jgi:hypothetical protein
MVLNSFKTLTAEDKEGRDRRYRGPRRLAKRRGSVGLARCRTKGQMGNGDIGLCASLKKAGRKTGS